MKPKKLYIVRVEYQGGGESFYVVTANPYGWIRATVARLLIKKHSYIGIKAIRIYPQPGEVIVG